MSPIPGIFDMLLVSVLFIRPAMAGAPAVAQLHFSLSAPRAEGGNAEAI